MNVSLGLPTIADKGREEAPSAGRHGAIPYPFLCLSIYNLGAEIRSEFS